MDNKQIDTDLLRELISYDPETGYLWWKLRDARHFKTYKGFAVWNAKNSNNKAFTAFTSAGYKQGRIFSKNYTAHRVAWALYYGKWPENQVDHINGDRSDNRIINLRSATNRENARNRGMQSNNTSGYKGVSFYKWRGNWEANICVDGKSRKLGYFNTAEDASDAYNKACIILHGDFSKTS